MQFPSSPSATLQSTSVHTNALHTSHADALASSTSLQSYHERRPTCPHAHEDGGVCDHGLLSPKAERDGEWLSNYRDDDGDVRKSWMGFTGQDREDEEEEQHTHPAAIPAERAEELGMGGKYVGERKDIAHRVLGDGLAEGLLGDGVHSDDPNDSERRRRRNTKNFEDPLKGSAPLGGGDGVEEAERGARQGHSLTAASTAISTTQWLARRHGVKGQRKMYLAYYIPFFNWIARYRWGYLQGDAIAALTMASFYIPMSLSYAANLGHIPPINGLYSFVFNPFVYSLLGTCPQMVVGPEAAGSLLLGGVVKTSNDKFGREDAELNARIAGVVTGMAGAVIFIAGLTRLGFLESVLSRPFLRGFISAIGFVIFADQLIPETRLDRLKHGASHGSSVQKLQFLFENIRKAHGPTCAVSFGSFAIIMVCRYVFGPSTLSCSIYSRWPDN